MIISTHLQFHFLHNKVLKKSKTSEYNYLAMNSGGKLDSLHRICIQRSKLLIRKHNWNEEIPKRKRTKHTILHDNIITSCRQAFFEYHVLDWNKEIPKRKGTKHTILHNNIIASCRQTFFEYQVLEGRSHGYECYYYYILQVAGPCCVNRALTSRVPNLLSIGLHVSPLG
jgi:hypothetical protein